MFNTQKGLPKNCLLAFGVEAIITKVYQGPSSLNKFERIVLNYSETSFFAHWIRDELRQIGPGFYLDKVY